MATQITSRVIRTFTLPVECFDSLKNYQRHLQHRADVENLTRPSEDQIPEFTNSTALAVILREHTALAQAAGMHGMFPGEFSQALYLGLMRAVKVAE